MTVVGETVGGCVDSRVEMDQETVAGGGVEADLDD